MGDFNKNQKIILNKVFEKGLTSRTELSHDLQLSKPAIADNLNDLLAIGIVEECGEGEVGKGGGRKPRLLRFNKNHKFIIAIELNYEDPIFVLGNLNGDIFNEFSVKISENANPRVRMELIKNAIHILLNSNDIDSEDLACIAISSPGVFPDKTELSFTNPQFKDWFDLDLPHSIPGEFHVNVLLKNDVNMAAVGESRYGAGRSSQNMLYISCGSGLGSGLILGSRLYEGRFNSAGEIFDYITPSTLTGKNLEDTISIDGLVKQVQESALASRLEAQGKPVNFNTVVEEYQSGNPVIKEFISGITVHLGCIVANTVNLLSLDTVIVGGEYSVFNDTILEGIRGIIQSHCIFPPAVRPSELGRHAGIMGLFAVAREQYFESIINKDILDSSEKDMD